MKKQSEDCILSKCHIWLFNNYPELRNCCWHVANERKQSAVQGAIMKSKGVVSGVPDYVVNFKQQTYYFEFKSEIGVLSDPQKKVHKALNFQGFNVIIIRTLEEFQTQIKNILQ